MQEAGTGISLLAICTTTIAGCPCGRGAVVERTPSVTKVVSLILALSERDFVGGRERTL